MKLEECETRKLWNKKAMKQESYEAGKIKITKM